MNPDVEWEQYKNNGRLLPHERMSPETKEALDKVEKSFEKMITELKSEHIAPIRDSVKDLRIEIKNRVTYKVFLIVVGIPMTIFTSLLSLIWIEVRQTRDNTNALNNNVSLIQYRLDHLKDDFQVVNN